MGATREIIAKAVKDEAFREQLLKNPKGAIHKEFGIDFPEGVTIRVHENSPTVINLVLPEPTRALNAARVDNAGAPAGRRGSYSDGHVKVQNWIWTNMRRAAADEATEVVEVRAGHPAVQTEASHSRFRSNLGKVHGR